MKYIVAYDAILSVTESRIAMIVATKKTAQDRL